MDAQIVVEPAAHSVTRSQLATCLGADVVAAATAAISITPIVCLIDSTIMLRAATSCSFGACLKTFLKPISKIPYTLTWSLPARLVFSVYFGTYATANSIDTLTSFRKSLPATTVNATTAKFLGTATVSTGLTVYKDSRLAQIIRRGGGVTVAVPMATYSLFTARDAITIFASFNLPTVVAQRLAQLPDSVQTKFGSFLRTESARFKTAQFVLPAAIQFVTTPIHLLGLDFYNRRHGVSLSSRFGRVVRDFGVAVPARVARIVPAFGVGGVINASMRSKMLQRLER